MENYCPDVSEARDLADVSEDVAHNYLQMSSSRDLTGEWGWKLMMLMMMMMMMLIILMKVDDGGNDDDDDDGDDDSS